MNTFWWYPVFLCYTNIFLNTSIWHLNWIRTSTTIMVHSWPEWLWKHTLHSQELHNRNLTPIFSLLSYLQRCSLCRGYFFLQRKQAAYLGVNVSVRVFEAAPLSLSSFFILFFFVVHFSLEPFHIVFWVHYDFIFFSKILNIQVFYIIRYSLFIYFYLPASRAFA